MWSIFQLCLEFFEYWIKFDIVQVNPEVFQKAVVCCFKYNVISKYVKEYAFEAPNNLVTGRIQIFSALIYEIAKLLKINILKSRKKGNPSNFFNSLICILIWFICHLICHLGDIHLVRTQNFSKNFAYVLNGWSHILRELIMNICKLARSSKLSFGEKKSFWRKTEFIVLWSWSLSK